MYRSCVEAWDKTSSHRFIIHTVPGGRGRLLWDQSSVEGHEVDLAAAGGADASKEHLKEKQ